MIDGGMKMKNVILPVIFLASIFGCASRTEPTRRYRDAPYKILTKANMSSYMDEAFRRVREREPSTRWAVVDETSGSIRVRCAWRSNSFDIALLLKDSGYNVEYITSKNLNANEDGSVMYYAYNKLVGYFLEELWDINHGRYTDPLRKATRSSFTGGDYWAEHNPQNAAQAIQSISRQSARAKNAQDGILVSIDNGIVCHFCKKQITDGNRFCPECGKPLVKICQKCQKPVSGRFCGNCGQKMD